MPKMPLRLQQQVCYLLQVHCFLHFAAVRFFGFCGVFPITILIFQSRVRGVVKKTQGSSRHMCTWRRGLFLPFCHNYWDCFSKCCPGGFLGPLAQRNNTNWIFKNHRNPKTLPYNSVWVKNKKITDLPNSSYISNYCQSNFFF